VASLGLVSPGAATEGVTPIFSWRTWLPFFAHHCHFYWFHSGVIPLEGVTPHLFLPTRPRLSTILFVNSPTIFFRSGVTPVEGVARGGPPLPP